MRSVGEWKSSRVQSRDGEGIDAYCSHHSWINFHRATSLCSFTSFHLLCTFFSFVCMLVEAACSLWRSAAGKKVECSWELVECSLSVHSLSSHWPSLKGVEEWKQTTKGVRWGECAGGMNRSGRKERSQAEKLGKACQSNQFKTVQAEQESIQTLAERAIKWE